MARVPPALFVLTLLWFACEALTGGPVGLSDHACRVVAGILAAAAGLGVVLIGVMDHVAGMSHM